MKLPIIGNVCTHTEITNCILCPKMSVTFTYKFANRAITVPIANRAIIPESSLLPTIQNVEV